MTVESRSPRPMTALDRIGQWTAGGTSLRSLDRGGAGEGQSVPAPSHDDDRGHDLAAWHAGEDDGDNRPGERLPVYRSEGRWRDPKTGDRMFTVRGFAGEAAWRQCEAVLGQGSQWQEAAALRAMLDGPHDIRANLLLMVHAQDMTGLEACIAHSGRYLRAWCERAGNLRGDEVTLAAATDALSLLCRTRHAGVDRRRSAPRNTPSLASRSSQYGCRNGDYAELRSVATRMYQRRLHEGEQRLTTWHQAFTGFKPLRGGGHGSGFATETWWHPSRMWRERSPPADR